MALTADDIDFFRKLSLRHPIALSLDDIPSLKSSDRCKLLAIALVKCGDREALARARESGLLDRLKAETLLRMESPLPDDFIPREKSVDRLMNLARQQS